MERSTENKSIQTDPVIILPIVTHMTKSDYKASLEDQLNSIAMSGEYNYAELPDNYYSTISLKSDIIKKQSTMPSDIYEIGDETSYDTVPETSKKSLTWFSPIYTLKKSLYYNDLVVCESGDEFEFISHVPNNPKMFCLKHLRTSSINNIDCSCVELDENTPLRLGNQSRGIIECFLLKSDIRYSFLIHRSDQDENVHILSANQHHTTKEPLISHYFIRLNKENNCFYLEHDRKLRHRFFPTFQQLVNDAKVQQFIPLSKPIDRNLATNEDELWQTDYKQLIVGNKTGVGEFGEVLSGKWKRNGLFETIDVAIKKLKLNNAPSNEFAEEICTMKCLRNKYLVTLLGISIHPITNEKLMITEFMADGDLKSWLEKSLQLPSDDILVKYCHQICLGMSYLEQKNYVHRDLACRNILLRGDRAKIADFGMTIIAEEDPYYTVSKSNQSIGRLPYRWTAPEIFAGKTFTTRSDVWSFGICLVEIWSKGGLPYPLLKHLKEVKTQIQAGYVHAKPQQCPEMHYKIIKSCLITDPDKRPSFRNLTDHFKILLIQKNGNMNVKIDNDFTSYYKTKERGLSSIGNLSTSLINKTDDKTKKQNNPNPKENQYQNTVVSTPKHKLSSSSLYDISEYETATTDSDSIYEITSPLKLQTTSKFYMPSQSTDTIDSSATSKCTESFETKPNSNHSETTNNNYGETNLQKEIDDLVVSQL